MVEENNAAVAARKLFESLRRQPSESKRRESPPRESNETGQTSEPSRSNLDRPPAARSSSISHISRSSNHRTFSAPTHPPITIKKNNKDFGKRDQSILPPQTTIPSTTYDQNNKPSLPPQSISLAHRDPPVSSSAQSSEFAANRPSSRISPKPMQTGMADNHVRGAMESINISVIGAAGVGKSTLIQRALNLRTPSNAVASSLKMSVDDVIYTVSLIELNLEYFDVDPERGLKWPKQMNGHIVPHMDGALLLYDVMNRESIMDLPQTLNALVYSELPTILVSCKCDNPVNTREIDTDSIEAACMTEVKTVKTASNVPESARLCLGAILRLIMAHRTCFFDGPAHTVVYSSRAGLISSSVISSEHPPTHSRAASSVNKTPCDRQDTKSATQQSRHSRTGSEMSSTQGNLPPMVQPARGSAPLSRQANLNRTNLHYQYMTPAAHTAPPLSAHPAFRNDDGNDDSDAESSPSLLSDPKVGDYEDGALQYFPDLDEAGPDFGTAAVDDAPPVDQDNAERRAKVIGTTFDELVDRLLSQHMSKADSNFEEIFLCLYRKFAAPAELFTAILLRLEQIATDSMMHYLMKTGTQLRIITVVAKWVSNYPGDFASPQTSIRLHDFIEQLSAEPAFAAAAQEMRIELQTRVVDDDDTGWARKDSDAQADLVLPGEEVDLGVSKVASTEQSNNCETASRDRQAGITRTRQGSEAASVASRESRSTTASAAQMYHSVEDYEAEAVALIPTSTLPLTKFRYRMCMDIADDDFAVELTRIDWVMFSSIRVRDLVRHVSLPLAEKEKCKSLSNVNRMISHFNHIARWVANMVLLRDKAKHRAEMLEKFMRIAVKLRQLNNYNGLAAIIAGINGSAVHRLVQTRALLSPECRKRFMRLELLMSTAKSHFAYRLAWENSPLPRIPFIPLHRRDLVSAEEGSRTFVGLAGDRINWKKFEVLAEVILPILKSQTTPYPNLIKQENARELILDCRMPTDEEEIYQRSLAVESASSGGLLDASKKKFPWFQK